MPNFLSFSGTSGRLGFWAAFFITACIGMTIHKNPEILKPLGPGALLPVLFLAWIYWSACVRRLHDLGRSGWWALLNLIPIAGLVLIIWLGFFSGDE